MDLADLMDVPGGLPPEVSDLILDGPQDDEQPEFDEQALLSRLQDDLRDAEAYIDEYVGAERAKALDYYLGRPMGDERPGRSSSVSMEVYKTVEGVSTAIANIYATAKSAIEFTPRKAEDVEAADQRTAAVEYVFYTQNNGFLTLLEAIKDGVLSKTGYLTWYWKTERRMTQERYTRQTPIELQLLVQDNPSVRIVAQKMVGQDPMTGMPLYDVTVNVVNEKGRVCVESVPPEDVLVTSRARSADLQRAPTVIWRMRKTREDLLKEGYDPDTVDSLVFFDAIDDSAVVRKSDEVNGSDEAQVHVCWVEGDFDGDGVVELRRVVMSGDTILEQEITAEISMSAWTPNIQPHEFAGRCPADDAVSTQEVMTAIKRQTLDNLYLSNNPMLAVDPNAVKVHMDDFYNPQIGRPLRAQKGAFEVISVPFFAQHSFPMLEYEQSDNENKTGYTRYSQGLDAKSLNQTARGIGIITNMSQQRIQLMARCFGELCLKPCLQGIARLLKEHGAEQPIMFRLNGKFAQIDPREWSEEFDMTLNVGLGVADKEQQLQHLAAIAQAQANAIQMGGLGKIVTMDNVYNVQTRIAENAGFKDPSFAWMDPKQAPPPPPPPPPPEVIKQQAETQREQMRLQHDGQKTMIETQSEERIAAQKIAAEAESKFMEANLRANVQASTTAADSDRLGALEQMMQALMQQQQQILQALTPA